MAIFSNVNRDTRFRVSVHAALASVVSKQLLLFIVLACSAIAQSPARIQRLVTSGNLEGMRWPNFSDYRVWLQKFYEPAGYAPVWLQGNAPTPQALLMIERFRNATQNGLEAEDYDGSRWNDRLQALKGPSSDPAAFDVALSVCTMRYISDLHIGRINPQHFNFDLDVNHKKYDLAHFVRERLVTATDIAALLDTVEPPFPGCRRSEQALARYVELARGDDGEKL